MSAQKTLLTRNELRAMGLNVSNTQFLRYEKEGLLHPIKVGGHPSARVHYLVEEAETNLLNPRREKLTTREAS